MSTGYLSKFRGLFSPLRAARFGQYVARLGIRPFFALPGLFEVVHAADPSGLTIQHVMNSYGILSLRFFGFLRFCLYFE
jgi:hypothetical protein